MMTIASEPLEGTRRKKGPYLAHSRFGNFGNNSLLATSLKTSVYYISDLF